jgi:lysophospholipase L1-like esterase
MVIGDSISIQYGPYLRKFINEKFYYDRKRGEEALKDLDNPVGANGGDSSMVLSYLKEQNANNTMNYDILLLNCGLHDIKTNPETGEKQVSIDEYKNNLEEICNIVSSNNIKLIWVRTTPVPDEIHNSRIQSFKRYNADVIEYNKIADKIIQNRSIHMIDLYTFTYSLGEEAYIDHVHFNEEIRVLQAAYIAGFLCNANI